MYDSIDAGEDFLAHAGVLGMKWGVRKSKEEIARDRKLSEDERLTPAQKKVLIGTGITLAVGAIAVGSILLLKGPVKLGIAKKALKSEIDELVKFKKTAEKGHDFVEKMDDVILPKGSVFHRVANTIESEISRPKYATYIDKDVLQYRSGFSNMSTSPVHYRTRFDALSDTKIASYKSMRKIAEEALDKPDVRGKTLRNLMLEDTLSWSNSDVDTVKKITKNYKDADTKFLVDRFFGDNDGRSWTDTSSAKRFVEELKQKGYAGLTDYVDSWGNNAEHAVVLFDDSIFKTSSKILTQLERDAASKLLSKFR